MKTQQVTQQTQLIKGTVYVYEDYPYWGSGKQKIRHKRVYIVYPSYEPRVDLKF